MDLGVGWQYKANFEDIEDGIDAVDELETYFDKIDFQGSMLICGTYFNVFGNLGMVLTPNALGDGFYSNEYAGITGIDPIDPRTLAVQSIREVLDDRTGTKNFVQNYNGYTGINSTVDISQDRMIYETRNPFAKRSVMGISQYANAIPELRTVIKFPKYRQAISRKLANVFRHYIIDVEKMKSTPLGRKVLVNHDTEAEYLLSIQKLIMKQESRHSSIATFDFLTSTEKTYGGKEPALNDVEKQTIYMLGLRMGVPISLMAYDESVTSRSALETVAEFLIQRRRHGPQKTYKKIIERVSNKCLNMWGYDGTVNIEFNPFVKESLTSRYDRVGLLNTRAPGLMSSTEMRGELGKSKEIEYGRADEQVREKQMEGMEDALKIQGKVQEESSEPDTRPRTQNFNIARPRDEKDKAEPKQERNSNLGDVDLIEAFLYEKGILEDVHT